MLPSPDEFDAYLIPDHADTSRAQLVRIEAVTQHLELLTQRAQRARALAFLAAYEAGHVTYGDIGHMAGVSRARVAQLIADGRLWRQSDQEKRNGVEAAL